MNFPYVLDTKNVGCKIAKSKDLDQTTPKEQYDLGLHCSSKT